MVAEKKEDMQSNLDEIKKVMHKLGMRMHLRKTRVMIWSRTEEECKLSIEGEDIEVVKKLKYLGVVISADGVCDKETEQQVGAAAKVMGVMRKEVLERQELQKKTKMRVFSAMVVLTILYGCETWTVQRRHESKIQACEMMFVRRVEGVTRLDKVRNEDVRSSLGQEATMNIMKKKQRRWKAKMEKMNGDRLVKQVYEDEEEVIGRRRRGRPRKRWGDNFK